MSKALRLLIVPVVLLVAGLVPRPAAANATDTVRTFYDTLLGVMQKGPTLGPKGRYDALDPVVGQTFDVAYMTRVAVGAGWDTLPKPQQDALMTAFGHHIAATYAERFDRFSGQKFDVTGEQPRGAGVIVDSKIVRADGTSVDIRYLMRQDGGKWRVADVYLSGTISELATRHSEFESILEHHGVDGLITTLNQKTNMLVSAPRT